MKWRVVLLIGAIAAFGPLEGCRRKPPASETKPAENAYGAEPDWNDPLQTIPLNYEQTQGQRIFYADCVWCHASSTPAGPSNMSNLKPVPPLGNDGAALNGLSDEFLQNLITLGGGAMSKSAMMPPWGMTLKPEDIRAVIAFQRAISQPPYHPSARPRSQYSEK
jgi:mono/diheme cytochrome c family protein